MDSHAFPLLSLYTQEWWRAAEAQGRGAAAFFPHLMGLPPMFLPQLQQSHDLSPFQARTPSKNGRATAKGRQKHTHALLPDVSPTLQTI